MTLALDLAIKSPSMAPVSDSEAGLAMPKKKISPIAMNKLFGELSMVQLQLNNIQAQLITMMGV